MHRDGAHPRPASHKHSGVSQPRKKCKQNRDYYSFGKHERWREDPLAGAEIGDKGFQALVAFLEEPFKIEPRFNRSSSAAEWPVLTICPAELFRHILVHLPGSYGGRCVSWAQQFVEVYGGTARSVVAADAGVCVTPPTDFDARFYIKPMREGREFDTCRRIVEDYLLYKLRQVAPPSSHHNFTDAAVVRNNYFQKQVVVGGFSLLSIGDSKGKVIDLEFSFNMDGCRKFFDDGNAFLIPLSLHQLGALDIASRKRLTTIDGAEPRPVAEPVRSISMSCRFEQALQILRSGELIIRDPNTVVNGLALYAHAICYKRLTPKTEAHENDYGRIFSHSFLESCSEMLLRAEDPMRFVKSFIKSHYTNRHFGAFAMGAQMVTEIVHHGSGDGPAANLRSDVCAYLGEMVGELAVNASEAVGVAGAVFVTAMADVTASLVDAHRGDERELIIPAEQGRSMRLLRRGSKSSLLSKSCLGQIAAHIKRRLATDLPSLPRCILGAVVAVLDSERDSDSELSVADDFSTPRRRNQSSRSKHLFLQTLIQSLKNNDEDVDEYKNLMTELQQAIDSIESVSCSMAAGPEAEIQSDEPTGQDDGSAGAIVEFLAWLESWEEDPAVTSRHECLAWLQDWHRQERCPTLAPRIEWLASFEQWRREERHTPGAVTLECQKWLESWQQQSREPAAKPPRENTMPSAGLSLPSAGDESPTPPADIESPTKPPAMPQSPLPQSPLPPAPVAEACTEETAAAAATRSGSVSSGDACGPAAGPDDSPVGVESAAGEAEAAAAQGPGLAGSSDSEASGPCPHLGAGAGLAALTWRRMDPRCVCEADAASDAVVAAAVIEPSAAAAQYVICGIEVEAGGGGVDEGTEACCGGSLEPQAVVTPIQAAPAVAG